MKMPDRVDEIRVETPTRTAVKVGGKWRWAFNEDIPNKAGMGWWYQVNAGSYEAELFDRCASMERVRTAASKVAGEGEYSEYPDYDWEDVSVHLDGKAWLELVAAVAVITDTGGELRPIPGFAMPPVEVQEQIKAHDSALTGTEEEKNE